MGENFRNYHNCVLPSHSVIFWEIYSYAIFAQIFEFFREINLLIAHRVKRDLGNSYFDQFGAKLRKFHLFGVNIDTLKYMNQLKILHRMVQKGFYMCLKFPNFYP